MNRLLLLLDINPTPSNCFVARLFLMSLGIILVGVVTEYLLSVI